MMSDSEEQTTSTRAAVATKPIEARWREFDRYKDDLLATLQGVCERTPKNKSFDTNKAWQHLKFVALISMRVDKENRQGELAVRAELLRKLGNTLNDAHSMVKEAKQNVLGHLFVQWCTTHGDPDFTDPIIEKYEQEFEEQIAGIVNNLAALAKTAYGAENRVREKIPSPGRPPATSFPGHDVILGLERVYRENTGKQAGAGTGPFARFVSKFSQAVGRKCTEERIVEALKAARSAKRRTRRPADGDDRRRCH
jgi:hypothetical protein